MGILQSRYGLNDDEYYSAITGSNNADGEKELLATNCISDELLAEELQLQEVLVISVKESCSMRPRTSPPLTVEALCNICMESKPLNQFLEIKVCSHKFCFSCVNLYVSAKLDQNVGIIGCPEPGCREGDLDALTFQLALPRETFERWCDALCQSMVKSKFYCPFSECSALLEAADGEEEEEKKVITASECPHCNRLFCAQCKVPWHRGIECSEFQKLGMDERGPEDQLLRKMAAELKWQRCPKCKITVERIDGCRFMQCRCGHGFCYVCASPMSRLVHYCHKCKI